ncbi:MAG: YgaP family membrane protein [Candidatus Sumerlaeota bacterium]
MFRERIIRMIAGTLVLVSMGLGIWASQWWFRLTAFVGANLLQSSITKWCLMDDILRVVFKVESEAEFVRKECKRQEAQ